MIPTVGGHILMRLAIIFEEDCKVVEKLLDVAVLGISDVLIVLKP